MGPAPRSVKLRPTDTNLDRQGAAGAAERNSERGGGAAAVPASEARDMKRGGPAATRPDRLAAHLPLD
jgi:hypothetical protein